MRRERGNHSRITFRRFDLRRERVGLDVDAALAGEMFLANFLRARHV